MRETWVLEIPPLVSSDHAGKAEDERQDVLTSFFTSTEIFSVLGQDTRLCCGADRPINCEMTVGLCPLGAKSPRWSEGNH